MSFVGDFNKQLAGIQESVDYLFGRAKEQVLSLEEKSNASFVELSNVYRRDKELQDTFVDASKIASTSNLVYDKHGWTNAFHATEVRFLDSYYEAASGDLDPDSVGGRQLLPGSNFSNMFVDQDGFWGVTSDVEGRLALTLHFQIPAGETSVFVNRLYLRTNATSSVEAFYRDVHGEWKSLGSQDGQHHIWALPFDGDAVRFVTVDTLFSISLVAAAHATYITDGSLITTAYTVEDLRQLSIAKDSQTPANTAISTFVKLGNSPDWRDWEEEEPVLLANIEVEQAAASGHLVPSGYIEDSLVVRDGFMQWEDVDATDYRLSVSSLTRGGDGFLPIPEGHEIIKDSVIAVRVGAETFTEGLDFTSIYNLGNNTIKIDYLASSTSRLPTEDNTAPEVDVVLRKGVSIRQWRTFVLLEQEHDVSVDIPASSPASITLRRLHIADTVTPETITNPTPGTTVTIEDVPPGLLLLEFENFDENDPPALSLTNGPYVHFANRYRLRSSEGMAAEGEYHLEPAPSGWELQTSASDVYVRYLIPQGYNDVQVRFDFRATQDTAPTLLGYELLNRVD